jgi:hypothetical protein
MLEILKGILPRLTEQMPVVVIMLVIMVHQQAQINHLIETCIIVTNAVK